MIKFLIFCYILVSLNTPFVDANRGHEIPTWTKYVGGEIETIIGDRKTAEDPLGKYKVQVNYPILDTVGDGWRPIFRTEDENGVGYVIKVKRNVFNLLDHEEEILSKLKQLARGKPLNFGIIDKFDYIKYGKISPAKQNVSKEVRSFYCNAVVETLLDTDIWTHVKPHTYKTSAKQIFGYVHELLGILKFIHENDCLHNDIDPFNVGFKNGKLVLFDFELATRIDHKYLIYVQKLPSGELIAGGIKRVLSVEALKCEKRTVVMQLKSAVYFAFVLFGPIIWDSGYIKFWELNPETAQKGVDRMIQLRNDFPIANLSAYYQHSVENWHPLCNKAFEKMWAAAEKGNHEEMCRACKIVINAVD